MDQVSGGLASIAPTAESSQLGGLPSVNSRANGRAALRQEGLPSGRAGYPPEGRPWRSTAVKPPPAQAAGPLMHLELICPGARGQAD
jgi:hypothetical protein